jgi:hypothetical protein
MGCLDPQMSIPAARDEINERALTAYPDCPIAGISRDRAQWSSPPGGIRGQARMAHSYLSLNY